MKTKLIELAKKVGFGAVLMQNVAYRAYPDLEPIRYYLWMCELQKWCRERYNININIKHRTTSQSFCFNITSGYEDKNEGELYSDVYKKYFTYEQALEEGLYQTLLLIQVGR
jgi:hypothetical protein